MRFDFAVIALSLLTSATASVIGERNAVNIDVVPRADEHELYKRRGGGGGGGRGGGGGGSSGGGKTGSGSSGGSTSGGGSTSKGGSTSGGSTSGGSSGSSRGSVPSPSYGGGRYYAGGSTSAYRSGSATRTAGIVAVPFAVGGLAFWPGYWAHGAYGYPYHNSFTFHNSTTNKNETLPVLCACAKDEDCSCDETSDKSALKDLVGNGSYKALNKSLINVGQYKGRKTLLVNGTLPAGTADATSAATGMTALAALGFWPLAAAVLALVFTA